MDNNVSAFLIFLGGKVFLSWHRVDILPVSRDAIYRLSQLSRNVWFGLVWWHIDLRALFNAISIFVEEEQWYYLTHS